MPLRGIHRSAVDRTSGVRREAASIPSFERTPLRGYAPLAPPSPFGHGALIGKIGFYSSTTNNEGDYGTGAGAYMRQISGAGLMLGAGYVFPIAMHLSARAAADIFFNVKITDPIQSGSTISETLVKLALGLDYAF